MEHPVVHFEVMGGDSEAQQRFYANAFGWKLTTVPGFDYSLVEQVGEGIGGGIGAVREGQGVYVTVYLGTHDIQATLDRAVEHGASVVMPVTDMDGMVTIALFTDPAGHVMGLVQTPQDEAP